MTDPSAPRPHGGWRSRGYLPHYDASDTIQHIVFRLADSLPAGLAEALRARRPAERIGLADAALDAGVGAGQLRDPRIAGIVEGALLHFDTARYQLLAWCVMPSHVHALIAQQEGWPLGEVVHAWKSFTAHQANRALGSGGAFWAPDDFDRMSRDERQAETAALYIEANPVKAGLCPTPRAWPWSSARRRAGPVAQG